ncbi:Abi-alpha family protein [Rhizobium sp. CECT 9324]|uniref:Abi-alpha family protein n=1 Tax=Rhizobium sp. CECT 9324 TaxID=2845820 RepID=UPI001E2C68CD|nr:Abi-alpha family protein [Rhizobium sp. CECT 9324]CAH0339411.1 hypothetical protein RHI9324_01058 [Rhizobium sp. CECT 9324]
MAESADLSTAIATELAKQIPIKDAYNDALKPGAKQVGMLVEDLTKVILLGLAPVQFVAALQDRYRVFLDTSVRRVPEVDRVIPAQQILGPVLEGIKYEPEDSPISEMFSQLLSSSMDKSRVQNAHPAFSQIVRQLSQDEATLLNSMWQLLKEESRSYRQQFTQAFDGKTATFSNAEMELDEVPRHILVFPENVEFYGQHLHALGITAFFDSAKQEPLWDDGTTGNDVIDYGRAQTGVRVFKELRFTDVGRKFMAAVSPPT